MSGRVRGPSLIATSHGGRVLRWSFAPSMISATPRSLLDALDGQREDRLHRGSAAINVQQLAGDEARLVSAEENHGVADVGWQAEAPHGCPAALVPVLDHLEHLGPARRHGLQVIQSFARLSVVLHRIFQVLLVLIQFQFGLQGSQSGLRVSKEAKVQFGPAPELFTAKVNLHDCRVFARFRVEQSPRACLIK
jgi:hypothetical protein